MILYQRSIDTSEKYKKKNVMHYLDNYVLFKDTEYHSCFSLWINVSCATCVSAIQ